MIPVAEIQGKMEFYRNIASFPFYLKGWRGKGKHQRMQKHRIGRIHGVIIPLEISGCRMSVILYPPCYYLEKRGQVNERIVFSVLITERLMLKMVLFRRQTIAGTDRPNA